MLNNITISRRGYKEAGDSLVCRDKIYVGKVVKTNYIYSYYDQTSCQLFVYQYLSPRNILFVLNEYNKSQDLLYNSPNYPVLNITDNEICLELYKYSNIIIDSCNLEPLSKYFDYEQYLSIKDVWKIRKTFFDGKFARNNCELFGRKELMKANHHKIFHLLDYREFIIPINGKPVLPRRYFSVLNELGNGTLQAKLLGEYQKLDIFKPSKEEGPIKKLKNYDKLDKLI